MEERKDLLKRKLKDLKPILKEFGIKGFGKKKKGEIVDKIIQHIKDEDKISGGKSAKWGFIRRLIAEKDPERRRLFEQNAEQDREIRREEYEERMRNYNEKMESYRRRLANYERRREAGELTARSRRPREPKRPVFKEELAREKKERNYKFLDQPTFSRDVMEQSLQGTKKENMREYLANKPYVKSNLYKMSKRNKQRVMNETAERREERRRRDREARARRTGRQREYRRRDDGGRVMRGQGVKIGGNRMTIIPDNPQDRENFMKMLVAVDMDADEDDEPQEEISNEIVGENEGGSKTRRFFRGVKNVINKIAKPISKIAKVIPTPASQEVGAVAEVVKDLTGGEKKDNMFIWEEPDMEEEELTGGRQRSVYGAGCGCEGVEGVPMVGGAGVYYFDDEDYSF